MFPALAGIGLDESQVSLPVLKVWGSLLGEVMIPFEGERSGFGEGGCGPSSSPQVLELVGLVFLTRGWIL